MINKNFENPIGFSTGCLFEKFNPASKDSINFFKKYSSQAIEINAGRIERINDLKKLDKKFLADFKFKALHAPTFDIVYRNDEKTKKLLREIELIQKLLGFDLIILHPDVVKDWEVFKKTDISLAFENMDNRKNFGRNIADMEKIFSTLDCDMVLDLQHVFTNDQSMKLAKKMSKKFSSKIKQYHISGFDPDIIHYPIHLTRQKEIIESVSQKNIPIIIESTFDGNISIDSQAKGEIKYIEEILH